MNLKKGAAYPAESAANPERWKPWEFGGACRIYRKAVTGLNPGWRLCGTLGTGNKKRTALKERQNQSECRVMKGA
jgi:hypothetical protein